jgi:HAD superfamily hydrolase (TIGR01509 family)
MTSARAGAGAGAGAEPAPAKAKGVLFDLDGVLVDSEPLKARAHSETVAHFGGRLDPAYYGEVMGRSHYLAAKAFSEAAGIGFDHEAYARAFSSNYARLLREHLQLTAGARELVDELRRGGYRLAVVSSSLRWMMDEALARAGLAGCFDAEVSADDVREEKPSPEPYRAALARLALEPGDAVVIEDSESGVASALAAGVRVIAVRHAYNARHDFSGAGAVLEGLADWEAVMRVIELSGGR